MALLNQKAFERKLQNMSSTQDSIQTVSFWMIHHKKHADDMVAIWSDQLKKAPKVDRRLILFYLANDVLQNSRKKGKEFSLAFTKVLRDSMLLLCDKSIKGNVERVIKIWEERKLFEKTYLESLRSLLDTGTCIVPIPSKKSKDKTEDKEKEINPPQKQKRLPPADFKPSKLIDALKALRNFEGELTLKEAQVNSLRIDASDLEIVRQLKDRTGGGKFCEEYELATTKLDEFSEMLRREQQERQDMIKALEDGEAFYDASYGEVKVIVHAYKTFGNRLTSLKKKVDAKVNKLAQKEAEKAKTGPVSAPQASFLTSGLPDVVEGSAPSTPTMAKEDKEKPEESKVVDPSVDNTEVADMEIEDDSDSEKSETSEEAVSETKGSSNHTPTSNESSDSQLGCQAGKLPEVVNVLPPVASLAPVKTSILTPAAPVQGSLTQNQQSIVTPLTPVGVVLPPYIGAQSVQFPGHPLPFRPGLPTMQSTPKQVQNILLQPSQHLPGPGQMISQGPNFPQMSAKGLPMVPMVGMAGVPLSATTQPPSSVDMQQPTLGGSGFVRAHTPFPVVLSSLSGPVQAQVGTVQKIQDSSSMANMSKGHANIGSPDSEESAPSPVGSPELHLDEGDETPETTPAPLGDVGVNNDTGFQTNKSFLETPSSSNLMTGPSASSAAPAPSGSPTSRGMLSSAVKTPLMSVQPGGQHNDVADPMKENGQNVSAVNILAQLLSRGRQLQQPSGEGPARHSLPVATPDSTAVSHSLPVGESSSKPTSKPLLTLIDSLFPKLSDSIKTLREKEQSFGSPQDQYNSTVTDNGSFPSVTAPARPLPAVGKLEPDLQGPVTSEQPIPLHMEPRDFQSSGTGFHASGPNVQRIGTNDMPVSSNNHDQRATHLQGPIGTGLSPNFQAEQPLGRPVGNDGESIDTSRPEGMFQTAQQADGMGQSGDVLVRRPMNHDDIPAAANLQGPVRGSPSGFTMQRSPGRPQNLLPQGALPFGTRAQFPGPHGPHFNANADNAAPRKYPPFEVQGERSPGDPHQASLEGQRNVHSPRDSHMGGPRRRSGEEPLNQPVPPPIEGFPRGQSHTPRGPFLESPGRRPGEPQPGVPVRRPPDALPHRDSPRRSSMDCPPFGRPADGPLEFPERGTLMRWPPGHTPRSFMDGPPQRSIEGQHELRGRVPSDGSPLGHTTKGLVVGGPPLRILNAQHGPVVTEGPARPLGETATSTTVPVESRLNDARKKDEGFDEEPPLVRALPNEADAPFRPEVDLCGQLPLPPPRNELRGPYARPVDNQEHRREFERWDHERGAWDLPRDRPGPPPPRHPDWRGPPVSPHAPPKRMDFRDDDPSMWTSFDSPGRPSSHRVDPNVVHDAFWEGPPEMTRFYDHRPPEHRGRRSFGESENVRVRHPGSPLKRPGPPPVPFLGPPKRPFY